MLAGVLPKNSASASPSGQYATSPTSISARASSSSNVWNGAPKYTSSPHRLAHPSKGSAERSASVVGVASSLTLILSDMPPSTSHRISIFRPREGDDDQHFTSFACGACHPLPINYSSSVASLSVKIAIDGHRRAGWSAQARVSGP